ncbi:hypothetical protein Vafri_9995 [Volvox africanus]|uniref:Tetratricopeptide SHNi-TPR domain-containing protein n=1 Tax=Volvox africanus TaxID=51714 RepID=A0A8J4B6S3_9CHLO|nr:hypothetical protein Vafri_9995 [Volvox africanus]
MADVLPESGAEAAVLGIEAATKIAKEGKELIDTDPEKAVELLCLAMRSYEKHYGSDAIECAPVYMYYGISLYELTRTSTDALGATKATVGPVPHQKADKAPAIIAYEAGEGCGDAVAPGSTVERNVDTAEPMAQIGPKNDQEESRAQVNTDAGVDRKDVPEDDEADDVEEAGGGEEGDNEEGGEEGGEVDDEEAKPGEDSGANDMKLAWDMLEVARVLYCKNNPEEHHDRLAEVHKALGDIKSEEERFEEAVECYKQSLHHLESMRPRNNRRLAEVQYLLSLVLTYLEQPEEALQVTQMALASLEAAVVEIDEKLASLPTDGSGGEAAEQEGCRLQAVSDDLRGVIGELHWNITGLKETIANNNSIKESLMQALLKAGGRTDAVKAGSAGMAAVLGSTNSTANAFAAPSRPASAAPAVSLGTVGRGSKRITLQPTEAHQGTEAADCVAAAHAEGLQMADKPDGSSGTKRTLEDQRGAAVAAADTMGMEIAHAEEQLQQAKKIRTEEPTVDAAMAAGVK